MRRPVDIKDRQVLDLVAGGESGGDYNAVYGIPVGHGTQPNFSNMTIAQVQQYQRDRIASGQPSSAVGKYQFIQSTLKETTERAGFDPNTTKFTPAVQDQLMTTRLDQRGLSKWKNGQLSNASFQDNLAKEFASVPVATAQQGAHKMLQPGDGYYDGDGINSAAHVDATKFSNNLAQINNESGTKFVNGDVDTIEPVTAEDPNWTPPTTEYKHIYTNQKIEDLAGKAARGDQQAKDELYLGYKQSIEKWLDDNPHKTLDDYEFGPVGDEMWELQESPRAEDTHKFDAHQKALTEIAVERTEVPMADPNKRAGTSIEVDEGNEFEVKYINEQPKREIGPEPNWYTGVDTPTYLWTFYLTNRKVFDAPADYLQNDLPAPGDAMIIAKSGVEATYTIDNFLFNSTLFGDDTKGSAQTSTIQFELKEPMGFTLLEAILSQASTFGFKNMKEATYVLKLEFVGRDRETGRAVKYDGIHYFPVVPYGVTSETGPDGTSYMFTCLTIPSMAAIENTSSAGEVHVMKVSTLGGLVDKLEAGLNRVEKSAVNPVSADDGYVDDSAYDPQEPRKTWEIVFDSTSKQKVQEESYETEVSGALSTFDLENMAISSSLASGEAKNTDDPDTIDTKLPLGSNVVSWLKQFIIKQPAWNEYVKEQMRVGVTTPTIEITTKTIGKPGKEDETDNLTQQKPIKTIITIGIKHRYGVVSTDGSDMEKLKDKNYQLERFSKLPIVKKYDYLYTGKNTEVLNYSAQFNMLFQVSTDPRKGFNTANSQQERIGTNIVAPVFLSDVPVESDYNNVIVNYPRTYTVSSAPDQQNNEKTPTQNELEASYAQSYAERTADTQVIEVDIIGDPYLLGIPGSILGSTSQKTLANVTATSDIFVAFVSFFPKNKNELENPFDKGPMDLYTSGIYELREVEHRFQQGQYLSKLRMYRDHRSSTYYLRDELRNL